MASDMKSLWYYDYSICKVGIAEENGNISNVFFGTERNLAGYETAETALIKKAARQLTEYFGGKRKEFDLPLVLHGTDFQRSVWKALRSIPFGETRSYKDIAVIVGRPLAARAIGMSNNRNPIAIIVPCHRVIGHNGSLVGYAGGLHLKKYLLDLEKVEYTL